MIVSKVLRISSLATKNSIGSSDITVCLIITTQQNHLPYSVLTSFTLKANRLTTLLASHNSCSSILSLLYLSLPTPLSLQISLSLSLSLLPPLISPSPSLSLFPSSDTHHYTLNIKMLHLFYINDRLTTTTDDLSRNSETRYQGCN